MTPTDGCCPMTILLVTIDAYVVHLSSGERRTVKCRACRVWACLCSDIREN